MPKQFLERVLDKLAEVTTVLVNSAKIRDDLNKTSSNKDLSSILEKTKTQIAELCTHSEELKTDFYEKYEQIYTELGEESGQQSSDSDTTTNCGSIKLVDINKLKQPKQSLGKEVGRKNVPIQIDSSVVVIDSSDEEPRLLSPPCPKSKKKTPVKNTSKSTTKVRESRLLNGNTKKKLKHRFTDSSSESVDSLSDHQRETNINKPRTRTRQCKIATESNMDPKVFQKSYVKVSRIPCEKLKEYYLKQIELEDIQKLTDMKSLKRKRTQHKNTDSSDSAQSKEKPKKSNTKKTLEKSDSSHTSESSEESDNDINTTKEGASNDNLTIEASVELAMELLNKDSDHEELNSTVDGLEENDNNQEKSSEKNEENPDQEDNVENSNNQDEDKPEEEHTTDKSGGGNGDENSGEKKDDDKDQEKNNKKKKESTDSDSSSSETKSKKTQKDKLLRMRLSSSDSEEELRKFKKKKESMEQNIESDDKKDSSVPEKKKRLVKKRMKNAILDSDSNKSSSSEDEGSAKSTSEEDKEQSEPEKKTRRRVKRVKDSSDDEDEEKSTRKQIRHIIGRDSLAESTKLAEDEEKERKARISEKQKKYNQCFQTNEALNATVDKVVLDFNEKKKKELLKMDSELAKKLKPHQVSGVRFMWDACFETLERCKSTKGSGCILAHCMGLGKTLQVIALSHTLLMNEETQVKKVLVVSPLNTILNWVQEYKKWLPNPDDVEVYELVSFKQNYERQYQVKSWHENGGVLVIGYDMFRNLSNPDSKRISKKLRSLFKEALVDPGPDLVICDEGHLLKNEKTNTSIAMNRIRSLRRIVLTGTPLQNNLKEYFCMVQFIKPNLLGTYKEYLNRFVNPITNGQYTNSTPRDIQIMRKRSHVLHKMLDGIVQRRDYAVLQPYLPPKYEYVLFLNLSQVQIDMYAHYMENYAKKSSDKKTSFLFVDFQELQRICTHPRVLLHRSLERGSKDVLDDDSEGSLKDFINDDDDDEEEAEDTSSQSGSDASSQSDKPPPKRATRATGAVCEIPESDRADKHWWQQFCDGDQLDVINHGSKLVLLFEILKECEQIGDKVLVFSQSLYSLNIIEYFLGLINDATENNDSLNGYSGSWCRGLDYYRLDGSSSCDNRAAWCKSFNSPKNPRARLFLISTRAGGLGINLVAANRVIIFDVSWNPSHDVQSIYRVYRFGQTKPSYIYRFVTNGTMEMKIYERQVTKQAISKRVIDEQQIDRHYNQNDLQELYKFDPSTEDRPTPLVPKDVLLGELLQKYEDRIYKYHEHQSLLENKQEEELNEDERKAAWDEFETEKTQRANPLD